ncbi:MAG: DNA translocase FtsK 4TM domain-containing protein [Patescibacteria group bacterium]|jgi:S-DNA-T family DNA segregation ATPase FtsK/SpoIIIE
MGRTAKRKWQLDVKPDTQRGIIAILLLALGLITTFSLFGLAGTLGNVLNAGLVLAVGVGRYLVPILFFITVYRLMYPNDDEIKPIYIIGLCLMGISIFGLLDIMQASAGGYIGVGITYVLRQLTSVVVAVIVFLALLAIAVLIVFNTSLEKIVERIPATNIAGKILRFVVALFSTARHRIAAARELAQQQSATVYPVLKEASAAVKTFSKKAVTDTPDVTVHTNSTPEQMELVKVPVRRHRHIDLPIDLLSSQTAQPTSGNIERNKDIIVQTLQSFGIEVELGPVSVGPTVTQYSFKPASGIKVAQVVSLQNDLALALAAHPIRIEAPIPGKSLIGVEVPNVAAAAVNLRELLLADAFKHRRSNLALLFGKDVSGQPFLADLDKMPHLLIAGSTGSGKSVCINSVLLSLLYQNGPDDLKLVLVDPKRVEFTMYNEIPHLLTPVITDVQKTINALKWTVTEMDRRYELLSNAKNRDIAGYNTNHPDDTLPYIVFIIDELADLMATAPREVEAAIVRLAQMARAVGIHLILATQRPSVDVITGLIKANITARCAFSTASLVDSRTILDASGAEKLLGKGDMLYISAEFNKPKRVQGAFVSEQEVLRVVEYLKKKTKVMYDDTVVTKQLNSSLPQAFNDSSDNDELLPEAKKIITQAQKASASLLQRRLRIGYARAARILDILEDQQFIGPADGAKPREIIGEFTEELAEAEETEEATDVMEDELDTKAEAVK